MLQLKTQEKGAELLSVEKGRCEEKDEAYRTLQALQDRREDLK